MKTYFLVHQDNRLELLQGEHLIGRSPECRLVFEDASVSRVHAVVILDGNHLYVEDKESRNGVVVNSVRITQRTRLQPGDQIAIGHQTIQVAAEENQGPNSRPIRISSNNSSNDSTDQSIIEPQPIVLMATLATKAIRVQRLDEADRLIGNLINLALKKIKSGEDVSDAELNAITDAMIDMSEASQKADQLTRLFEFHLALEKLISRELMIKLYNVVRTVGYRTCPRLQQYVALMASKERKFNAGDKFVLRRLEGLAKLCG